MGVNYWDSSYESGRVPWDPGPYDGHLPAVIADHEIAPCRVVDIGCGTGKSLVWLAEHGFDCTGIEIAPTALEMAEKLARSRGVECDWLYGSFPHDFDGAASEQTIADGSFGLAVDRGVFHLHTARADQRHFVDGVSRVLARGGLWYSLLASSAKGSGFGGPPRWSKREITNAVEARFEIVSLTESIFNPREQGSMPAWVCVLRKHRTRAV